MLLVVGLAELLLGRLVALLAGVVLSVERAHRLVEQVQVDALLRALDEGALRICHLPGLLELQHGALVDGAQGLGRLQHLEAAAPGVEGVVVLDLGPLEHEEHASVRQVEGHGHLGLALVGAVPQPDEAPDRLLPVEEVEVHALVEVRLRPEGMREVVFRNDVADDLGHGILRPPWSVRQRRAYQKPRPADTPKCAPARNHCRGALLPRLRGWVLRALGLLTDVAGAVAVCVGLIGILDAGAIVVDVEDAVAIVIR